jgi:ABC-type polysaccharide/polyol phosphate export permease
LLNEVEKLVNESEKRFQTETKRVTRALEEGLAIPYDRDKIKLASLELKSKKIELKGKQKLLYKKIQYLTGYSVSEIDAVHYDLVPYLIMSFGLWLLYWLFTIWFRIPFYDNLLPLTFIAKIFTNSVSFIGVLVSILIPNQLKATEILMVVATPSFILSGFTWPLSQMPVWVQGIANVIPLTHFLKAFRILIIENGTLSQTSSSIWNMIIIGSVCAILAYIALYFKKKNILKTEI